MYSNISIVLFLLLTIFLGYQVFNLQEKRNVSAFKRAEAKDVLDRHVAEEQDLRKEIDGLETPEGRDRAIRERFNVVKEGEGVIYVIEDEKPLGAEISIDDRLPEKKNFFEKIVHFFQP